MPPPKPPFSDNSYGPPLTPVASGNGNTYKEGDDIPSGRPPPPGSDPELRPVTHKKLGDYLSNVTRINKYKISGGTTESLSHNDPLGSPPVLDAIENNSGAANTFIGEVINAGAVTKNDFMSVGTGEYKNPGISFGHLNPFVDPTTNASAVYKKGVGNSRGEGHTLLASVPGHNVVFNPAGSNTKSTEPGPHPIQQKTATILTNNRFHPMPGSPYVDDGRFSVDPRGSMGSLQKEMGKYNPRAQQLFVKDLQDIGRKMMVAGVGFPTFDGDVAALLPSPQQMGLPYISISVADLNAVAQTGYEKISGGYILTSGGAGSDEDSGVGSSAGVRNEISSADTYGHLNSYFESFSGTVPLGMITATIGSILALLIQAAVLMGLIALAQLLPGPSPAKRDANDARTLPLGAKQLDFNYSKNLATEALGFLMKSWGIPTLESNNTAAGGGATHWMECVILGIGTFLGKADLDNVDDIPDILMGLLAPGQAGFVASIFRVINRDLEDLVNIARPLTSGYDSITNQAAAVIALITEFGEVKSIKFLNLCAKIGDIIKVADGYMVTPVIKKNPDLYPENPVTRIFKSRVGGDKTGAYDQRSVLRHGALPSKYLIPTSLITASAQYFDPKSSYGASSTLGLKDKAHFSEPGKPSRIPVSVVKDIEDQLDCEYVPFYFQDLRTNEIVAFHAFLDSISDDYSPEWNAVSGYGRMDSVQIFNKTTRSMSISFIVAATNQDDFDEMWYSLNKLTTLIYPQYSPGTVVKTPADKKGHIMPFSQIPTASPLIRVRIGDLVKSNYSRFNLARIFGVGYPDTPDSPFHVTGTPVESNLSDDKLKKYQELIEKTKIAPKQVDDGFGYQVDAEVRPRQEGLTFYNANDPAKTYKLSMQQKLKIIELTKPGAIPLLNEPQSDELMYKCRIDSDGPGSGEEVWATHAKLSLDMVWFNKQFLEIETGAPGKAPAGSIPGFFDPSRNAVVRTFESTAGRGLAAAITSFNLDYADAPWSTDTLGSRAPLWVKVSMSFAVIHDIEPGIDSDGFNRAPIYPVGEIINKVIGPDIHGESIFDNESSISKKRLEYAGKKGKTDES